jgi:hypothetical protein
MTKASAMESDATPAPSGDASDLIAQLGLPEAPEIAAFALQERLTGGDSARFLASQRDSVIVALDWPVIVRAAEITRLGHHRDLLALDAKYAGRTPKELTEASFRVGRRQLSRLRGLKDQRVVQKYLDAIERGEARGWNPVVFGIVLTVFGIPLRQGLIHYATAILRGYARQLPAVPAAGEDFERWFYAVEAPLPVAVNRLLSGSGTPALLAA